MADAELDAIVGYRGGLPVEDAELPPPPPPFVPQHNWEQDGYHDEFDDDDHNPDPLNVPADAAEQFLEELVGLYLESVLSARSFCILCAFGHRRGAWRVTGSKNTA